jgi:hypothetical protein
LLILSLSNDQDWAIKIIPDRLNLTLPIDLAGRIHIIENEKIWISSAEYVHSLLDFAAKFR